MGDLSRNIYRRAPVAVLIKGDGSRTLGRGAVARLKGQAGMFGPRLAAEIGLLCSPLYVFTGWLEGVRPGDALEQAGQTYRVLLAEELAIGGTKICLRVLLEKEEGADESP